MYRVGIHMTLLEACSLSIVSLSVFVLAVTATRIGVKSFGIGCVET